MPPKAKFTKEEIISAALNIAERDGIGALTARALGEGLGSSARPIFTVFQSMDEVQESVIASAKELYASYVIEGLQEKPAFKGVGKAYIRFAAERPKLFQLLFMHELEGSPDVNSALGLVEDNYAEILKSIEDGYGVDEKTALKLYYHLWIYSHGISVLIATKVCRFSAEEISDKLTEVFSGLLQKIKAEGKL